MRVPTGSGRLELYDPRGKSPLRDLEDPLSAPSPPFHRVRGIQPVEGISSKKLLFCERFLHNDFNIKGKLVLFPGWLVHSVLKPSVQATGECSPSTCRASIPEEGRGGRGQQEAAEVYRVSLSLNLKGEWQDTAALHIKLNNFRPQ